MFQKGRTIIVAVKSILRKPMASEKSPLVPFTRENIAKCVCGQCPVQVLSRCVKDKMAGITDALRVRPFEASDIPRIYCATGKAACADLDMSKQCKCSSCAVYQEYSLETAALVTCFCRDGKSEPNTFVRRFAGLFK
jgi:hypothetical protein